MLVLLLDTSSISNPGLKSAALELVKEFRPKYAVKVAPVYSFIGSDRIQLCIQARRVLADHCPPCSATSGLAARIRSAKGPLEVDSVLADAREYIDRTARRTSGTHCADARNFLWQTSRGAADGVTQEPALPQG